MNPNRGIQQMSDLLNTAGEQLLFPPTFQTMDTFVAGSAIEKKNALR
ncbi:MAG TPA: hypothetical protein VHO70_01400 [Chitinispirillaceae bacterium]|nr:hypothetical protein [Chitinispirillaceae bacterium]